MGKERAYIKIYKDPLLNIGKDSVYSQPRYCYSTEETSLVDGVLFWEFPKIFEVSETTKFDFRLKRTRAYKWKNDEIGHSEFRLSDQKFSMEESHRLPLKGVTRLPYDPIEGKYIVEVGTLNIKVELLEPVQRNCIKKFYVDLENDRNRPDSNRINREAGEERSTDENDFDEGLVQPFESNKNMITELHVDLENDRNRKQATNVPQMKMITMRD
ncbi:hypothetical protein QYM36_008737 [Artemia franciscana]|uniref:Uncharacterized protein n=1 Tax=Artemia franciscana TaxID=6661 RepID=A0AA88HRE0_ARTSF|nr:hypothetical protein QYM36_008737 [Artemia franciscana]